MKKFFKMRFAIFFGYNGSKYYGLQKIGGENCKLNTIEKSLEKALYDSNFISENNFGDLKKISWARGSRTDKGVHASLNTIKCKLNIDKDIIFKNNQNKIFLNEIYKKKLQIDNKDNNNVEENENNKILEKKVDPDNKQDLNLDNNKIFEEKKDDFENNKTDLNLKENEEINFLKEIDKQKFRQLLDEKYLVNMINKNLPEEIQVFCLKSITTSFSPRNKATSRKYEYILPLSILKNEKNDLKDEEILKKLQNDLRIFRGVKNFHNYSKKTFFEQKNSLRFIMNTEAEFFEINNYNENEINSENEKEQKNEQKIQKNEQKKEIEKIEQKIEIEKIEKKKEKKKVKQKYIKIKIEGQAFLYNQIRKMIGMIIYIFKNNLDEIYISKSFENEKFNILLAPSHGLLLDRIFFKYYNEDQDLKMKLELDCEEEKKVEIFKKKFIYDFIIRRNEEENIFDEWYLNELQYIEEKNVN